MDLVSFEFSLGEPGRQGLRDDDDEWFSILAEMFSQDVK